MGSGLWKTPQVATAVVLRIDNGGLDSRHSVDTQNRFWRQHTALPGDLSVSLFSGEGDDNAIHSYAEAQRWSRLD